MATAKQILAQINKEARQRHIDAANTIPPDVVAEIKARAKEAMESQEAHKITGGWVILSIKNGYDIRGLLEHASIAIMEERRKFVIENQFRL